LLGYPPNNKNRNDTGNRNNNKIFRITDYFSSKNSGNFLKLKFLIPSIAAGGVNGRNCEVLREMEKDSGAKLSLERISDPHHVENERICFIEGDINCIIKACYLIFNRIQSLNYNDSIDKTRIQQVCFLVTD